MKIQIDHRFAEGYCEKKECLFLYQGEGKAVIRGKRKSYFCKRPEMLREHLQEHFESGGEGAAKMVRGSEESYVLQSQAKHFVDNGRGELVSEKPYVVKLPDVQK